MTSPTRVLLDPKRAAETVTRPFDFSAMCTPADTLSGVVVTVTVWSGVDPTPQSLYSFNSVSGQIVNVVLGVSGVTGCIYVVAVKVTTPNSGTIELDGLFAVIPQGF